MAIIKAKVESQFVTIPNETMQDSSLSFEARGVLGLLLSMPDDWSISNAWLIKQSKASKDRVKRILDELIENSYLVKLEQSKNSDGKFSHNDYMVYPVRQSHRGGKTVNGKTVDGKQATTNKQSYKETNNKETSLKDSVQTDVCTMVEQDNQDEFEQEVNPFNDQQELVTQERLPTNQVKQSEGTAEATINNKRANENKNHFDKDVAFEAIWKEYPARNGAKGSKANTKRLCGQIAKTRDEWVSLLRKVRQYKLWASHNGKEGTETVMQTTTFFGKQKQGYLEDWTIVDSKNQLAISQGNRQTSSKSHNAMSGFASMAQPVVNDMQEDFIIGEIIDV